MTKSTISRSNRFRVGRALRPGQTTCAVYESRHRDLRVDSAMGDGGLDHRDHLPLAGSHQTTGFDREAGQGTPEPRQLTLTLQRAKTINANNSTSQVGHYAPPN